MLNVISAWLLRHTAIDPEEYERRELVKSKLTKALNGDDIAVDAPGVGTHPGIIYDADGKPRPAPMAYDGPLSDDLPPIRQHPRLVQPLPPETVPTDDYDNPFPHLAPPLG